MTPSPFLLIDAGNSRIKWALAGANGALMQSGVFAHPAVDARAGAEVRTDAEVRGGANTLANLDASPCAPLDINTRTAFADEPAWSSLPTPCGAWISNVAGQAVAARLATLIDRHWPQLPCTTIRSVREQCGVTNSYAEPERLGSDRWAGMIGARAAFPGEPLLIATLGTGTTLEALQADGLFAGGLIAPGWALMMQSLSEHTAQLPTLSAAMAHRLIDSQGSQHGRTWFATDTPYALAAGCLLAQAGLIERAWRELSDAWRAPVRLVLSGGAADHAALALAVPHTRRDGLVLSGLALIAAASGQIDSTVRT
jgi:type III pantothenate kinase